MPGPVSSTTISTDSPSVSPTGGTTRRVSTVKVPPSAIAWQAFKPRFQHTWRIWSGSTIVVTLSGDKRRMKRICPPYSGVCSSRWIVRSEEHTSELQSRLHLVCRLLLEKKKKENQMYTIIK